MRTLLRHYRSSTPKTTWMAPGVAVILAAGEEKTYSGEGPGELGVKVNHFDQDVYLTLTQKGKGVLRSVQDSRWCV